MDVATLRKQMEDFGSELALEQYANLVGLKDEVDSASIFAKYHRLREPVALDAARKALAAEKDERERRRLRFLEADVVDSIIGDWFVAEEDQLSSEETAAEVEFDGRRIPYRGLSNTIRDNPEREKRQALVKLSDEVKARFLPRHESLEVRSRDAYREMGEPDEVERFERLHGIALEGAVTEWQRYLADTAYAYERELDAALRAKFALYLAEAERHDISRLMRGGEYDAYFPREALVPFHARALAGLGFEFAKLPNLTVDLEDRPKKDPRAFVMPVRVPTDIRLVTRPRGGLDDWRSLFHESGHALHFSFARADLPYEDRTHGDAGVSESYAFLFEHLFEDEQFLAEAAPTLKDEPLRAYLKFQGLDKLQGARFYAAALDYDVFLARHSLPESQPRYVEVVTSAMKVAANPLDYLSTDGFYGLGYLRAWTFESMHRRFLRAKFGREWWHNAEAGAHLARLFAHAEALTLDELCPLIGERHLRIECLEQDAHRLLSGRGL
ncbi:MAG: hypothetical protein ACYDCK_12685 [Thermoplasmatota archaeon]